MSADIESAALSGLILVWLGTLLYVLYQRIHNKALDGIAEWTTISLVVIAIQFFYMLFRAMSCMMGCSELGFYLDAAIILGTNLAIMAKLRSLKK